MGQAVLAEAGGALLSFVVDAALARFTTPGRLEPPTDLGVGKADHGGLVEVIQNLAVEAVAVNCDGLKVALVEQGAHQAGHIVLGRLQREKGGGSVGMTESALLDHQRPEEINRALGQAADGRDGHLPASADGRAAQRLVVGGGQRALGHDHQNGIGWDARFDQAQEAGHGGGRLARACGSFEEELALDGPLDEGALVVSRNKFWHS